MHKAFSSSLTYEASSIITPASDVTRRLIEVTLLAQRRKSWSQKPSLPSSLARSSSHQLWRGSSADPVLPWSYPTHMLLYRLQAPLLTVTQLATVHLEGRENDKLWPPLACLQHVLPGQHTPVSANTGYDLHGSPSFRPGS